MKRLGVDTGGTFTDLVLLDDDGSLQVRKVLSTPEKPELAILAGIQAFGLDLAGVALVHGSTVATNAVLEGKGARTVYVANAGFTDVLTIGRQQRSSLYDLQPPRPAPPVPAELCLGVACRVAADGRVSEPLSDRALAELVEKVARSQPEAVAINLLFSYLDPALEQRIEAALPAGLFVSRSSRVLPEIREYERGMATWLNARVGPVVGGYLSRLQAALSNSTISVMQSSGDTIDAAQAAQVSVRMLLSGPAGGLAGARFLAEQAGHDRVLTFDMGGTSTDVALLDGDVRLTTEGRIGAHPVAVPMVDMHTIGAGGGSIAWIDQGGMLQVGPQSAGADPGPACYGRGGSRATVTDANLLLGRLQADSLLGGDLGLDPAAAQTAVGVLADGMGCSLSQAARDIIAVANEHMARALREISVKRGVDPGEHVLVSFGGAGGLHVCALAELLDMRAAMVPLQGGVLSALGMLVARPGRQLSRTRVALLEGVDPLMLEDDLAALRHQGVEALRREGCDPAMCEARASVDLRYAGQSYTLNLPWEGVGPTSARFHRRHQERYGHRLELPVELVNLRQSVLGEGVDLRLPPVRQGSPIGPDSHCSVAGIDRPVPRYRRDALVAGQRVDGPALIAETVATSWVAPGWSVRVDAIGNLMLNRG